MNFSYGAQARLLKNSPRGVHAAAADFIQEWQHGKSTENGKIKNAQGVNKMSLYEVIGTNNPEYLLADPQGADVMTIPASRATAR